MADQLERRFEGVDRATMPDLWGAIEVRAQRPATEPRGPRVAALVLAVLVAAAVIGGLVWALSNRESQPAVQPGVNGDIGYVGSLDGATHLFVVDPKTGVTQQLTGGPGTNEYDPVWSPDGTQVVFERLTTPSGTGSTTSQLVLREQDGTERVLGTCAPPAPLVCGNVPREGSVTWSPDGTRLAWVSSGADDRVQVLDLGSGTITSLCGAAQCGAGLSQISWSPDGTKVAFSNAEWAYSLMPFPNKISQIWVQAVDGSSPAVALKGSADGCTSGTPDCFDVGPSWSPDGNQIAFVSVNVPPHTAVAATMRPDGTDVEVIDSCPGHDGCTGTPAPVWSPDGTRFALPEAHDPATGKPAIRIFTPSVGDTVDLPLCDGCSASSLAWSPDGKSLTFFAATTDGSHAGIYTISPDGQDLRRVVGKEATGVAAWLPAGAITTPSASASPSG